MDTIRGTDTIRATVDMGVGMGTGEIAITGRTDNSRIINPIAQITIRNINKIADTNNTPISSITTTAAEEEVGSISRIILPRRTEMVNLDEHFSFSFSASTIPLHHHLSDSLSSV